MKTCFQRGCIFVEYRNHTRTLVNGKEYTVTRRIETQRNEVLSNIRLSDMESEHHAITHNHGG